MITVCEALSQALNVAIVLSEMAMFATRLLDKQAFSEQSITKLKKKLIAFSLHDTQSLKCSLH